MFSEKFITTGLKLLGSILMVVGGLAFAVGLFFSVGVLISRDIGPTGMGGGIAIAGVLYGLLIIFIGFIGVALAILLERTKA